ncbi:hypothetical protein GIB67_040148, partial [Kingdonia uniflora]
PFLRCFFSSFLFSKNKISHKSCSHHIKSFKSPFCFPNLKETHDESCQNNIINF